jgi:hypothetical protein
VTGASKVTALFSKTVKQGTAGSDGPPGNEGAPSHAGESGVAVPAGVTGGPDIHGPAGRAGNIELITCETVKGKHNCTTKLTSGTVKLMADGSSARATLSRHGLVYATGSAHTSHRRMTLRLTSLRQLRPGRYTLTLMSGAGKREAIRRESFTVV